MYEKKENISYLNKCKICGNKNLKKVIKLNEQYISATFVKSNENNDLKKIKTPLTLSLCVDNGDKKNCGHLQLYEMINPDLLYRKYFYRSATNDTMRKDLKNVVDSVLKITQSKQDDIIVDIVSMTSELNFKEKIVLITGGASGFGF